LSVGRTGRGAVRGRGEPFDAADRQVLIGASVDVVVAAQGAELEPQMADAARYAAKSAGRSRVHHAAA
jgi:hypothetical protein